MQRSNRLRRGVWKRRRWRSTLLSKRRARDEGEPSRTQRSGVTRTAQRHAQTLTTDSPTLIFYTSLAFDCTSFPATKVKLRARTPLERPSEGAVREVVLDLGTGDAMVGRSVKKNAEA
jgi:hypothetical protein